jgi:hypothetical protein
MMVSAGTVSLVGEACTGLLRDSDKTWRLAAAGLSTFGTALTVGVFVCSIAMLPSAMVIETPSASTRMLTTPLLPHCFSVKLLKQPSDGTQSLASPHINSAAPYTSSTLPVSFARQAPTSSAKRRDEVSKEALLWKRRRVIGSRLYPKW